MARVAVVVIRVRYLPTWSFICAPLPLRLVLFYKDQVSGAYLMRILVKLGT